MRRHLIIAALVAIVALGAATATRGEQVLVKGLRVSFAAEFTPHSLPRDRPAPVRVTIKGGISTTDGSHPPALRKLEIALNRHGRLSTAGLPTCPASALQSTTTQAALDLCRRALVGRGRFEASLSLAAGSVPANGTALVVNSRRGGKPALLLHLYVTTPVQVTFILPLVIHRQPLGDFGTVLSAKIPKLAGGFGSVTNIELTIDRRYGYAGRRYSFVSASCAAPAGFPGAVFPFARGSFYFADGRKLVTTLTRNCHVRPVK